MAGWKWTARLGVANRGSFGYEKKEKPADLWPRVCSVVTILECPALAIAAADVLSGFGHVLGAHVRAVPVKPFAFSHAQCDAAEQDDFCQVGCDVEARVGHVRIVGFDCHDPLGVLAIISVALGRVAWDGLRNGLDCVVVTSVLVFLFARHEDVELSAVVVR